MQKIYIRGKNDRLTRREIKNIISFSSQLLLGKKLTNNVIIIIKNCQLKKNEWGYCGPTDYNNFSHREFEILLNNRASKKNQIITLLHEMIHVKQYARNELKCYDMQRYKWLGKKLEVEPQEYETLPWEIEASMSEEVLYRLYLEYERKNEQYYTIPDSASGNKSCRGR